MAACGELMLPRGTKAFMCATFSLDATYSTYRADELDIELSHETEANLVSIYFKDKTKVFCFLPFLLVSAMWLLFYF